MTKFQARQGDVFLFAAKIPASAKPSKADPRGVVLAEGEATGHHHRIGPRFRSAQMLTCDEGTFLRVTGPVGRSIRAEELSKILNDDIRARALFGSGLSDVRPMPAAERTAIAVEAEDLGAVALDHEEHGEHYCPPGEYRVRIQREYTPDAVRQVVD